MSSPPKDSPYRLIVEGSDDKHTIIHLMAQHGYLWDHDEQVRPYIHEAGSQQKLVELISPATKTYKRSGIVMDVDDDLRARWASVATALRGAGYEEVPGVAPEAGLIVQQPNGTRFGVWLMPDNVSTGRLEEFLQRLIPASDPSWQTAENATDQAIRVGARLRARDRLKGSLHAWLAWFDPPGIAFGTAIKALAFQHDTDLAVRFASWFRRLFVDEKFES